MFRTLITSTAVLSVMALAACSGGTDTAEPKNVAAVADAAEMVKTETASMDAPVMDAKVKAVLVYADWCGSCKVLDPKLKSVRANNNLGSVGFYTLDYSDKNVDGFYAQAAAAGVEMPVKEMFGDKIKTGLLLLVDADDNRIIGQVTKAMSEADIAAAMKAAVAAS